MTLYMPASAMLPFLDATVRIAPNRSRTAPADIAEIRACVRLGSLPSMGIDLVGVAQDEWSIICRLDATTRKIKVGAVALPDGDRPRLYVNKVVAIGDVLYLTCSAREVVNA